MSNGNDEISIKNLRVVMLSRCNPLMTFPVEQRTFDIARLTSASTLPATQHHYRAFWRTLSASTTRLDTHYSIVAVFHCAYFYPEKNGPLSRVFTGRQFLNGRRGDENLARNVPSLDFFHKDRVCQPSWKYCSSYTMAQSDELVDCSSVESN